MTSSGGRCVRLPTDKETKLKGNQVRVKVEEMFAGNFSCHLKQDGSYLNHTLVMVQTDERILLNRSKEGEEVSLCVCVCI